MNKIAALFLAIVLIVGTFGCDDEQQPAAPSVSGKLTNVTMFAEDNARQAVLLYFDGGRMVRLRTSYNNFVDFPIGKSVKISYDDDLVITNIETEK